jgi:hypothetical protein
MTLVAGTPRFACQCPNGRVKLFCLGELAKKSGCCCDGECCTKTHSVCTIENSSTRETEASTSCCCCQHHGTARAALANDSGCFTDACCTKSFHRPEVSVIPSSEKPVLLDAALQALLASQPMVFPAVPWESSGFRREHQRPPPTDLVITLQHFLI